VGHRRSRFSERGANQPTEGSRSGLHSNGYSWLRGDPQTGVSSTKRAKEVAPLPEVDLNVTLHRDGLTSCRSAASGAPHATAFAPRVPAARRLQRLVRRSRYRHS
jgi:hypothetical protein